MEENLYNKLRQDLFNKALHSYGTGFIRSESSKRIQKSSTILTFLGILVPILVGGIVTTYGTESNILKYAIIIAAPISLVQLVLSVWSIVNRWNEKQAYYLESQIENYSFASKYETLAKFPPEAYEELKKESEKIDLLKHGRDIQDSKEELSEKQKRKGMRYALRKYKRICAGCNIVPISMKPTDCEICGNF